MRPGFNFQYCKRKKGGASLGESSSTNCRWCQTSGEQDDPGAGLFQVLDLTPLGSGVHTGLDWHLAPLYLGGEEAHEARPVGGAGGGVEGAGTCHTWGYDGREGWHMTSCNATVQSTWPPLTSHTWHTPQSPFFPRFYNLCLV